VEAEYFFNPVKTPSELVFEGKADGKLVKEVFFFDKDTKIVTEDFDIAIIGVETGINSQGNKGCANAPGAIRSKLYNLRNFDRPLKIIDLGNVKGKSAKDKYIALREVTAWLLTHSVIPVVIGGSHDLTIPMGEAFNALKKKWNLAVIDHGIDFETNTDDLTSLNFLGKLQEKKKRNINDITFIGAQKYWFSEEQEHFISSNYYTLLRLGEIRGENIKLAEPYLRDSDLLSLDATSVKFADMPAQHKAMPNGLFSHEVCQLVWYAGLSDRMKAFGLFELNPDFDDKQGNGVALGAQIVWHFLEGVSMRYNDFPARDIESYKIFIVHLDDFEIDIRFFNNPQNGRWWVEVPGDEKSTIISCTRQDYDKAAANDLPEKWIFFLKKSASESGTNDNN